MDRRHCDYRLPLTEICTLTVQQSFIIVVILSFSLLVPLLLEASPLQLAPSITVEERFDDNIFSSQDDREHDFVTVIQPALELSREAARLRWEADYAFHFEVFSRHTELNKGRLFQSLDGTVTLNLSKDAHLQLDEYFSFTPEQPEFLGKSRIGNILGEGIRTRRDESIRNVAGVSIRQPITQKVILKTRYRNGILRYDDPSLIDSTRHEVSAGIDYEIASWSIPTVEYRYRTIAYEGNNKAQVHFITLGYSRKLSRILSGHLSVGHAFPREQEGGYRKAQIVSAFSIYRSVKDWDGKVQYARKVGTSGGFLRELSISDRVSISLNREVTRNLTSTLIVDSARNRSIEGRAIDIHSSRIRLGVNYTLTPNLSLSLGYSYFRQDSDGTVGRNIVRNQALISLTARRL